MVACTSIYHWLCRISSTAGQTFGENLFVKVNHSKASLLAAVQIFAADAPKHFPFRVLAPDAFREELSCEW